MKKKVSFLLLSGSGCLPHPSPLSGSTTKKCVCNPYHLLLFPVILSIPVFSSIILNYLVLVVVVSGLMEVVPSLVVVVSGLITSTLGR